MNTCANCNTVLSFYDDYTTFPLENKVRCYPICKHANIRHKPPSCFKPRDTSMRCKFCINEKSPCFPCVQEEWNKMSDKEKEIFLEAANAAKHELAVLTLKNAAITNNLLYRRNYYDNYETKFEEFAGLLKDDIRKQSHY
jgi:hypothetical protein